MDARGIEAPGVLDKRSSVHARAARRAARQCVAANRAGDRALADYFQRVAAAALERHIQALRRGLA